MEQNSPDPVDETDRKNMTPGPLRALACPGVVNHGWRPIWKGGLSWELRLVSSRRC